MDDALRKILDQIVASAMPTGVDEDPFIPPLTIVDGDAVKKLQAYLKRCDSIILIEDGHMFEGTLDQFKDCFFDNATYECAQKWAEEHGWSFKIKDA
jgi:hypothetical protein